MKTAFRGTVGFGAFSPPGAVDSPGSATFSGEGEHRLALFFAGFLFLPAAVAWMMPELSDEKLISPT